MFVKPITAIEFNQALVFGDGAGFMKVALAPDMQHRILRTPFWVEQEDGWFVRRETLSAWSVTGPYFEKHHQGIENAVGAIAIIDAESGALIGLETNGPHFFPNGRHVPHRTIELVHVVKAFCWKSGDDQHKAAKPAAHSQV